MVYLINYILKSGTPPQPVEVGDTKCNRNPDVTAIVYLINYIFTHAPPLC